MAIFIWQAKDRQGLEQSGAMELANREVAIAVLRRKGRVDIKVKKKPIEIVLFPEKVDEKDI